MKKLIILLSLNLLSGLLVCGQNYIVPEARGYIKNPIPDPITSMAPDNQRLNELRAMLKPEPEGIGFDIAHRDKWRAIGKNPAFKDIITKAEKALSDPDAKVSLEILVYAECIENKGRFVPQIGNLISDICSRQTWVPEIHDHAKSNRTGTEITADLQATTMAAILGTVYYWLGESLDEGIRELIRSELKRRVFDPVRKHSQGVYHGGMYWIWRTNNWNAVCWSNVVIAAMSILESDYERAFFLGAAENSIHYFTDSFFEDGYCQEGVGYWNYGFSNYVRFADVVYKFTSGEIDWMADEKIASVALFGLRNEILPDVYPVFADCNQDVAPQTNLQNYINRKYQLGLKELEQPLGAESAKPSGILDFVWYFPSGLENPLENFIGFEFNPLRDWYPEGQMLICRPGNDSGIRIGAAMKGGDNAAPHNHNDIGSFIVAINGAVPITDPGAASYRGGTAFLSDRYGSKILSSYGHNVPVVDRHLQIAGKEAKAVVISRESSPEKDILKLDLRNSYKVATMDLSDNYNLESVLKLMRTFIYDRTGEGSFSVIDEVEYSQPSDFETALMTLGRFEVQDDGTIIATDKGESLKIEIETGGLPYELIEDHIEEPMRRTEYRQPTRLGIRLNKPVASAKIIMKFTSL
ncbi:MAG TPA: hypothetical protein ENI20_01435 [Bacteroides sp.]|nr:hypothetical protein [Bacteroides sp.]